MTDLHQGVLHYIYHHTTLYSFVTLYELEVAFGKSGFELRGILEDLKERGYVVEAQEGYQITREGIHHGRSRWA